MRLREKWNVRLAAEGRQRLNLFDPNLLTDEEQIEMFGHTTRSKGKEESSLTSSSRGGKKNKEEEGKKKKLIKYFSSLSPEEQKELLRILS